MIRVFASGLKGKPVHFDGNDLLWSTHDFDHLTDTGYTIVLLQGIPVQRIIGLFHPEQEIFFLVIMVLKDDGMQKVGFQL